MDNPDKDSNNKTLVAVKLKGAFATNNEAQEHARSISKTDNRYDVFVAPFGKWLLLPPDVALISDQHTHDNMLTNILQHHNENDELERVKFDRRKDDLMKVKNKDESDISTSGFGEGEPVSATDAMNEMTSSEMVNTRSSTDMSNEQVLL